MSDDGIILCIIYADLNKSGEFIIDSGAPGGSIDEPNKNLQDKIVLTRWHNQPVQLHADPPTAIPL